MTTPVSNTSSSNSSSISASSGQAQLNGDYTSFLTLLTTQLQNQDPLSPMDTNAFTSQLVEMNGVQQQLLTNSLLQQLVSSSTGVGSVGNAVSMIGKSVTATTPTATMQNGQVSWTYNLNSAATAATVQVLDANNNVVWSGAAPSTAAGPTNFTWNGQTTTGVTATTGTYTLKVTANDANMLPIDNTITVSGTVTGVSTLNGATQLNLGATVVPYSSVSNVQNPS
jgi:flagellar basal-body rod modification protein FlgD